MNIQIFISFFCLQVRKILSWKNPKKQHLKKSISNSILRLKLGKDAIHIMKSDAYIAMPVSC